MPWSSGVLGRGGECPTMMPLPAIQSGSMEGHSVVVIAALNLVLDFDYIEQAAERGAPKYLEWYGAFALMVTPVWLYVEILRLLSNSGAGTDCHAALRVGLNRPRQCLKRHRVSQPVVRAHLHQG